MCITFNSHTFCFEFYSKVCFVFNWFFFESWKELRILLQFIKSNRIKIIVEFCVGMLMILDIAIFCCRQSLCVALYIVRQSIVPDNGVETIVVPTFVIFLKCESVVCSGDAFCTWLRNTFTIDEHHCAVTWIWSFYAAIFTTATLCVFMTTRILHNFVIRCSIDGICFTLCYKVQKNKLTV